MDMIEFVVPWRLGRRATLRIGGDRLTWRDRTIAARHVTKVRIHRDYGQLPYFSLVLVTPNQTLRFRTRLPTSRAGQVDRAISAVIDWVDREVAPHLAAALAEQVLREGWVQIGAIGVEPTGLRRRTGLWRKDGHLAWDELHGFNYFDPFIFVLRAAPDRRRGWRRWAHTATRRSNTVLIPHLVAELMRVHYRDRPATGFGWPGEG